MLSNRFWVIVVLVLHFCCNAHHFFSSLLCSPMPLFPYIRFSRMPLLILDAILLWAPCQVFVFFIFFLPSIFNFTFLSSVYSTVTFFFFRFFWLSFLFFVMRLMSLFYTIFKLIKFSMKMKKKIKYLFMI